MVNGNASIEVPTLTGRAKIKIPSGTPSGKIFRLKGKGFPSVNGYGKGDQLIYVNVFIPKSVSSSTKKIIQNLDDDGGASVESQASDKSFLTGSYRCFETTSLIETQSAPCFFRHFLLGSHGPWPQFDCRFAL